MIYLLDRSGVGGIYFLANSLSPNDPVFKAWKYRIVLHFTEIPVQKFSLFSTSTKFQQHMFKRINWILTSPESPTKISICICLTLVVYSTLVEYENRKAKLAHYFCPSHWLRWSQWSTTKLDLGKFGTSSYWSLFIKGHWIFQHLSSILGINRSTKNINVLWKHYFRLW